MLHTWLYTGTAEFMSALYIHNYTRYNWVENTKLGLLQQTMKIL